MTAYCACYKCCRKRPGDKGYGITASGARATQGVTIAAPKNIPFGTKIAFNGNTYIVQDRGGSIKNKRLDLYFESHTEASKWGVRKVDVTIMYE